MKRVVYSPKVEVYVKSDEGVVDLSPYVTNCMVNRKTNQVSPATVTFRNPKKIWTEYKRKDGSIGPRFHPQDPIIIVMTRMKDRPVQVFTGYCDKTPYITLYPGVVKIEASCTLKRLLHTYWDPFLNFTMQFLQNYGWQINGDTGIVNRNADNSNLTQVTQFNDGSIANLLFAVLEQIGGWDESTIFIEKLPDTIGPLILQLHNAFDENAKLSEEAQNGFEDLLKQIIGAGSVGAGAPADSGSVAMGANPKNIKSIVSVTKKYTDKWNLPLAFVLAVMDAETTMTGITSPSNRAHAGWFQMQNKETGGSPPYAYGPGSHLVPTTAQAENLEFALSVYCPAAASWGKIDTALRQEANWRQWGEKTQGAPGQYVNWATNVARGKKWANSYGT